MSVTVWSFGIRRSLGRARVWCSSVLPKHFIGSMHAIRMTRSLNSEIMEGVRKVSKQFFVYFLSKVLVLSEQTQ